MAKLKDDQIKWILSLDAKGLQSELTTISSETQQLTADNKLLESELKLIAKQMAKSEKEMKKLAAAGKEDSNAYREAKATYKSAASDMADYTKRIRDNKKAIEENDLKAKEMVKNLKVEDMTMTQLKKRAAELQKQLDNTSKSVDSQAYDALEKKLNRVNDRMGELRKGAGEATSVLQNSLAVFAGNMMTKGVDKIKEWVSAGVEWIKTGIGMANGAEGVVKAFSGLNNSKHYLDEMRAATKSTVSDLELMEKAVSANELGIGIDKMANLMKFAQMQAKKLGTDIDEMADSIVNGLGRKSTLVLDNLGISASRVQSEVKKTGDFTVAVLNIVNEKLKEQGDTALTGAEKAAQAATKWENAQLKVGQKFQWLGNLWDEISGNIADKISNLAGDTDSLNDRYQNQLEKVADLELNTEKLARRYDELKGKAILNKDEQTELNSIMNILSNTVPGVITQFDQYGNVLSINTAKVYDFIAAQKAKLKVMNADAIDEQTKKLKSYTTQVDILQDKLMSGETTYFVPSGRGQTISQKRKMSEKEYQETKAEYEKYLELQRGTRAYLDDLNGTTIEHQIEHQKKMSENRTRFTEMNKKELDAWIKDEKNAASEFLQLARQIRDQRFTENVDGDKQQKDQAKKEAKILLAERKSMNELIEALDTAHNNKLAKINKEYLDGKIKSESEYNRKIFSQEQAAYIIREQALTEFKDNATRKEVKDDVSNKIAVIQNKRLQQEIAFRAKLEQIILVANPQEQEKRAHEERLRDLGIYGKSRQELQMLRMSAETEQEKTLLQQKSDALELLEKQHQDNLLKIRNDARAKEKAQGEEDFQEKFGKDKAGKQKAIEDEANALSLNKDTGALAQAKAFDAEVELQKKRLSLIQEEVDARNAAGLDISNILKKQASEESKLTKLYTGEFNRRKNEYRQYGASIGAVLGDVISGQEDALKSFADVMLDILFDTITQMINTEIIKVAATGTGAIARSTAEAMATPDSVLSFGATGFARIAILTGVITAAMMAAKSALKGLIGKKTDSSSSDNSASASTHARVANGLADGGYNDAGIDGGYTGPGSRYQVKGTFPNGVDYHAGEYVIAQPEMKIPVVSDMIRAIESIRRQRTGSNPMPAGLADGGYNDPGIRYSGDANYSEQNITAIGEVLSRLGKILDRAETNGLGVNYQALKETNAKMKDYENFSSKY
ncbi:MAG: hypothetical protein LBR26_13305 [Prevotella sp.]|jgi:hypothetical protein|nr:hypothetical protein [Prevotella sp.]